MKFTDAPAWFQPLGWTLLHFLWQGSLIAAALALAKLALKPAAASARYNLACLALLLALAAPAVTFWRLAETAAPPGVETALSSAGTDAAASAARPTPVSDSFRTLVLPALVGFWLCGVLLLSLRYLAACWLVVRQKRERLAQVSPDLQASLRRMAHLVAVSRPVQLFQSARARGPMVAGWLRPVILMPAAALAGLSTPQFEAVLAHELAHIRRNDYLVNLLATAAETLLFYHPAVWWISKQIRREREHCCDDLAVQACGDPLVFARALVELEQFRAGGAGLGMAVSGGSLTKRIQRVLGSDSAAQSGPGPWFAAIAFALSAAVLFTWGAGASTTLLAQTSDINTAPAYERWLNEDVVYLITPAERKQFRSLTTNAARARFIERFWRKRNPSGAPENRFKEEHYRRISYVNAHYARFGMPGWKTDLGRIYIVYGPPDEIEAHPSRSKGVEQWRYRFIPGLGNRAEFDFDGPHLTRETRTAGARR
ncbi:MAG: M56 family metallopeptidase [Bryobacteraceae bacterium]